MRTWDRTVAVDGYYMVHKRSLWIEYAFLLSKRNEPEDREKEETEEEEEEEEEEKKQTTYIISKV